MKETREILVNWVGDLEAFKAEFPTVRVVPIPEMLDDSYMIIYECYTEIVNDIEIEHDFDDEYTWLDDNGDLEVIGKWKSNGNKKPDNNNGNNHNKTKYKKYLRDIWNEDTQKFEKAPEDTPVNCISGWNNRDITE